MKKTIKLLTLIITFVFLLTGCGKQIELKDRFSTEDNNSSILNKLTSYTYTDSEGALDLTLQSVEVKADKSFKGRVAIVYKKAFNDEVITYKANEKFLETKKIEFEKKLIESLENIVTTLKDTKNSLTENFTNEDRESFNTIINEFETLLLEVNAGSDYSIDEMLTKLNNNKALVENFLIKNVNKYVKGLKESVSKQEDYVDALELLSRTYINAIKVLPNYSGAKDYSGFYNKVVTNFNDDLARHANISNNYDKLMNWTQEQIVKSSNGTVDYLYIIKENKKPTEIEKAIKSSNSEYVKLNDINTYNNILDITDKIIADYKTTLNLETTRLNELKNIKKTLEDVKSTETQSNITNLNRIKTEVITSVEEIYSKRAMDSISLALKDIVDVEGKGVKYDKIDKNENEIFVLLKFEQLDNFYNNTYINTVGKVYEDDYFKEIVISDLTKIKAKYIINEMISPELAVIKNLLLDINYETESLKVIELELEPTEIKNKFIKDINLLEKEYSKKTRELNSKFEDNINNLAIDEIIASEHELENELVLSINRLNQDYKEIINTKVNELTDELKNYDKTASGEGVAKVLEMLQTYNSRVLELISEVKSLEQIVQKFNELYTAFFYFKDPVPYSIRISIEGAIENKLNLSGKVDLKDNFQINATPSGDKAIRIVPNSETAMFVFTLKSFGSSEWKMVFIFLIILLIAIRIISKKVFKKVMILILLLSVATIILYPVTWIIGSSFNKSQSLLSAGISPIPKEVSLLQYERLFKTTNYLNWYLNTFKIAFINMILSVLLTVSTAYVFSRFKFKGKKKGLITILVLQMFPSFLGMVAIYILLSRITFLSPLTGTKTLIDTHLGLILVYACGQIPFNTWLVKGYFDTIPRSLDEAARIDGASNLKAFWKIILPLGRPIIAFVAVTNFMSPWMDFIFPRLIIKTPEKKTLAIGLYEMINGRADNAFTMFAAGAVLVAVPITILFSYFQKYIVTGLASGAVKG